MTRENDHLRLVAADGWTLAIVLINLPRECSLPEPGSTHLFRASDMLDLSRDLKKGPRYECHIYAEPTQTGLRLIASSTGKAIESVPVTSFPRWKRQVPKIGRDGRQERMAIAPIHMSRAAALCAAMDGKMIINAAHRSKPMRIDCISENLNFLHQPPRALIAAMPSR